ncbi:sigma-70 family RNA polymerase sigma factor [Pedobacter polaris]|uniref:Sigma-70 family RNA polymerase sigma factor n=1 Tax=Pedobacter polaris TaxID=2571273 RepID=A0A4U1CPM7_9SPHI|nr:sigma-70 family RNA polymerase sigma factor [Pedobacter polaris]TKC10011.1 sigma-70 family RNA polymerase sigma factor [Pedobacter polaris]
MTPIQKKTDHELIAMCKANNDLGYSELYGRYAKRIYNSIHRIVSHTAEAEDILQETFLTVFKEIDKLANVVNFEGWIKRIAINRSISHLRKKKIEFSDVDTTEIVAEKEYDIQENELFETQVSDVRKSIDNLPQGYKTIMCLYLFENIPQEEIGAMLGISHNTVRTQYHRAKKKVLLLLKDKVYE